MLSLSSSGAKNTEKIFNFIYGSVVEFYILKTIYFFDMEILKSILRSG